MHPITWGMVSICLVIGGAYFDHLIKIVSAGFSTMELLYFFLVINNYFVGKYTVAMWIYTSYQIFNIFIYLYIDTSMDSWIPILLNGLWSVTILIYFDNQIIYGLVSGNPFKLASVSFWNVP